MPEPPFNLLVQGIKILVLEKRPGGGRAPEGVETDDIKGKFSKALFLIVWFGGGGGACPCFVINQD